MEFSVGLMLILLGVLNLTGAMVWISEKFSPAHPQITGSHAHVHEHGWSFISTGIRTVRRRSTTAKLNAAKVARRRVHKARDVSYIATFVRRLGSRPRWVGCRCVAGVEHDSSAKVAVLYLVIFGVGTIAGMMLITVAISLPFSFAGYRLRGSTGD